mmetsp:Transcript_57565/g.123728  ORF Transcript_57565/g.123728 Transcript_57565/m.123728 type:complete len:110 (-) Transcript_57565:269-598(-)
MLRAEASPPKLSVEPTPPLMVSMFPALDGRLKVSPAATLITRELVTTCGPCAFTVWPLTLILPLFATLIDTPPRAVVYPPKLSVEPTPPVMVSMFPALDGTFSVWPAGT